ncbi:ABC transporter substrate-binding protein [Paenibacillus sp. BAC0078]
MKKTISGIAAVSMAAVLFAGCSSSTDTGEKDNAAKGDANYPVVKIAYPYAYQPTDEQAIEQELNNIMREKANAEVDLVGIEFGNWATQLNLILTGGGKESIDLFDSFLYTSLANLVTNGQVMDLTELMESQGKEITGLFSGGLEGFLETGKINGKQYGIPSLTAYSNENFYYVRKEDAHKAGIDWSKVNNLDSMSEAILKLKASNPDKAYIPGSTQIYWNPKNIDYLGDTNFLGVLLDPTKSTTVENYYESDYFKTFLGYVKEWKKNGVFSPDPLSNSNPTLNNILMGITNGTTGYAWDTNASMLATEAQNNVKLEGAKVTEALSTTSDATTFLWHISAFSKNPDAAMRVLSVLYTNPESAQLVGNGIEGLDYEFNDDGQMVYPAGKKDMSELGWQAASLAYWPNQMLNKTWYYEPVDIYTRMMEKNKNANKSLALGFSFDSTKVADQITASSNVIAQYYTPLMYGEVDIDSTLPDFQKALKSAGIDEIIAEKQKQLDAWLASK